MKHINKIFFSAMIAIAALSSCNKILNTSSLSVSTSALVFSNETDAQAAVSGVYALFNQDAFTSRSSNNFSGNTDMECGGATAAPDNSRRDIWTFECTDANADLLTVWNNAYKAINAANEVVEGVQNSAIKNNTNMKHILGEALTLRAYWYYVLINQWGDVPYKATPSRAGDNFYAKRMGRDTILTNCIHDLVAIEPNMLWADQLDYGIERINREFVMGMIARLSLMRGGYWLYPDMTMRRKDDFLKYYDTANMYCRKLMSLKPHQMSSFATVFMNENKYVKPLNDDVLYEVAFQPGFGDVAWCNGIRVDAGTHAFGGGSNYLSFPITYYHSFDTTDLRLPVTCSLIYYDLNLKQQPAGTGAIAPGKWNRMLVPTPLGSASSKGTGINWPLMRYSDVLLMLAESENELKGSPDADAKNALMLVRQRAFPSSIWTDKVDNYISAVSANKTTFFNAIVNERAWEFGGECLRKYDLERWNLYGRKVADMRTLLTQIGIDANAGSGPTSAIPDYMYYKWNIDGTISWLNKFTKTAVTPPVVDMPNKGDNPTGYYRVSWGLSLYSSTNAGNASDYALRTWRGYKDNSGMTPLRYILPVHNGVVTSSLNAVYNSGLYGY